MVESIVCPACLAPNATGETCVHCRAPIVLGGRYVATEVLSRQRSARTLGGIDREHGTPVIIKTLGVAGLSRWKELELFQRGIGVLRGLDHRGVPHHLDDGEFVRGGETFHYWVQQRLPGRSVADALAAGQRWTEAEARRLAAEVLEILAYLQGFSPPILHRDIKPSNIFACEDGHFALIDFDLVKDTLEPEGGATTALGTAGYAPLEQLMGRAVPASDLYGLGATLVAVLSRKSPADLHDADTGRLDFRGHVRISDDFAAFIERLVDPRVGRRPADARAALATLDEGPPASPAPAAPPAEDEDDDAADADDLDADPDAGPTVTALVPVEHDYAAIARMDGDLVTEHPTPRWLYPARMALVAAVVFALPWSGWAAAGIGLGLWFLSAFVVRYPVTLPEGHAIYKGGLSNSDRPGRHWLRHRILDDLYSISTSRVYLSWQPAPTRMKDTPLWLELDLRMWVQPREDDVGQFFALLKYRGFKSTSRRLAMSLRQDVLTAVVEAIPARCITAAQRRPVDVLAAVEDGITKGLAELGLVQVEPGPQRAVLGPRTDDLGTEDRASLTKTPPD